MGKPGHKLLLKMVDDFDHLVDVQSMPLLILIIDLTLILTLTTAESVGTH